jgi:hypothetical protein
VENPAITVGRPLRWLAAQVGAFMMGLAMGDGLKGLARDFVDPEVRQQLKGNRQSAKREKAMARQVCETTDPAARAMLVQMLIGISENKLPQPSAHRLRSAAGFAREQVNDTRIDSLTAAQERNIYERTSRRASFMKMCIGTGVTFAAYIEENHEAVVAFIRPSGITTQQLRDTLHVIGSSLKAYRED